MSGYNTGPRVALTGRYKDAAAEFGGIDFSVANVGDNVFFNIPFKCRVVYAGVIVTTIIGGDAVVKFDRRHTAGADGESRTDGTIANITLPDTTAVGQVIYDKAAQGSLTEEAAALLVTAATCQAGGGFWRNGECQNYPYGYLEPGMEVVVQSISGTTGKGQPILIVDMCEETMGNLAAMVETA
ncbi:MAG: hypothetical protein Q7J15_08045 [Candidatus Desulfaltia sp.]|nr:hypothetical protein [Candidatus Desulfaltia sp.]